MCMRIWVRARTHTHYFLRVITHVKPYIHLAGFFSTHNGIFCGYPVDPRLIIIPTHYCQLFLFLWQLIKFACWSWISLFGNFEHYITFALRMYF